MGEAQVDQQDMALVNYIKDHMVDWLEEKKIIPFPSRQTDLAPELLERMVRVEMQLVHQNEKFDILIKNMDKRFEEVQSIMDKRFEQVDKRFEEMQNSNEKRFEQVDKRFEEIQNSTEKRFEDMQHYMDKRFGVQIWVIGIGFTFISVMMSLYRFLG